MRLILCASIMMFAAACSPVDPISDQEELEIDCLAAQTVIAIREALQDGTENGASAKALAAIRDTKITTARETLHEKYSGRMDDAFLEYDINHRLLKIETALTAPESDPEAVAIMEETLALGQSCEFGGET